MQFKFKIQPFQTAAVQAVADCFEGQHSRPPGPLAEGSNAPLTLTQTQLLKNIQRVQRRHDLPVSPDLMVGADLDIEMETGTGKTYCYTKTMFELQKRYGWSKFIVIVPSIAILEGVQKSLRITADHFADSYGERARFFVYASRSLHNLESFAADAGLSVMIINIQAFNSKARDNRRIFEELDNFQSRRPIDVIAGVRPILILDEPQKMEGKATQGALPLFNPLTMLRYSATHRTRNHLIYRLSAVDAYSRKLVKKIAVRGIETRRNESSGAYLYLDDIDITQQAPVAKLRLEVKDKAVGIERRLKPSALGTDLYVLSNGLDAYRGFVVTQIDGHEGRIEFANGHRLEIGETAGDVAESEIRRIQIRETIKAHLEREAELCPLGIKVLSLFFIDEVVKYRDYSRDDERGAYARLFEDEYEALRQELLENSHLEKAYRDYLEQIDPARTHSGYFSVDRHNRFVDPAGRKTEQSDDAAAYDLILKDKERLLSFGEPVRFIFSHSALREGWDNPNVFTLCMLKHSGNTISRRQEIGRGLRLAVDKHGERTDYPGRVHDINVLTVVANESYRDFVAGLQSEVASSNNRGEKGARFDTPPKIENGRRTKAFPPPERPLKADAMREATDLIALDSAKLIEQAIAALNRDLRVAPLHYTIATGGVLPTGAGVRDGAVSTEQAEALPFGMPCDLIGTVATQISLTRKTVAKILSGVDPAVFEQFRHNPRQFMTDAARLIDGQKAAVTTPRTLR